MADDACPVLIERAGFQHGGELVILLVRVEGVAQGARRDAELTGQNARIRG